jgi:imidazolonepropionase
MKTDLIIYNAGQLLTCGSHGKPKRLAEMRDVGLIENGALAAAGGKILAVGKSEAILKEFESENTIDARGRTVAPGFVECHTHVVFAGNRLNEFELKIKGADYMEILAAGGGILSTVRHTREASLTELIEQSRGRLDKLLALGATTAEVKTGYGLDTETELKMLGAILKLNQSHPIDLIPTLLAAHAVPPEFRDTPDEYVELVCRETIPFAFKLFTENLFEVEKLKENLRESVVGEGAAIGATALSPEQTAQRLRENPFFIDVFCEKNAFDLAQSRKVLETGSRFKMKIKAHVDEFTNLGGARMAIELGAVSIDHLDAISEEEIRLLAASDTIGVVTPTVNFNFGARDFADARKLIDSNCAVALSTDYNPGSAPCPSLPQAMAIACRYQKLLPAEAFNAATVNAAFAVARGDAVGSLEAGKWADVLIFDTRDYREIAYEFGGNLIEKVIKKGKIVNQ